MSPAEYQWAMTYQISPIFLVGGIVGSALGGTAPIIYYLQGSAFTGLGYPGPDVGLDDYFAQFIPLPGSDLINNEFGTYPFANQQTAANAIITQPLAISMMMICPARQPGDYATKNQIISALRGTLQQHNLSGGTYTVVTPAYTYINCLNARLRDMTGSESKQVQWRYQWDFGQPLVSLAQAAAAQNSLMQSITSGQQIQPNANGVIDGSTGSQSPTPSGASGGASSTAVPSSANNPTPFVQSGTPEGSSFQLQPNSVGNPGTTLLPVP